MHVIADMRICGHEKYCYRACGFEVSFMKYVTVHLGVGTRVGPGL